MTWNALRAIESIVEAMTLRCYKPFKFYIHTQKTIEKLTWITSASWLSTAVLSAELTGKVANRRDKIDWRTSTVAAVSR